MKKVIAITLLSFCQIVNAEWNIEEPLKDVSQELEGSIFGRNFTFGEATWDEMTLTISSKNQMEGWPESELIIFWGNDGSRSECLVTPDNSSFEDPHVHMKFGKEGKEFPGTLIFMSEYSMYLKVIEKSAGKAKMQIHISLPDYQKSTLMGVFEAKLQ